jgi:hypothetical protein
MTRLGRCAVFALLLLAGAAPAAAEDDPVAFLRAAYAVGEVSGRSQLREPDRGRLLSRGLIALLEKDKGPDPRLEFQPFYDGQDWKVTNQSFTLLKREAASAIVETRFENFDSSVRLQFDLVREDGVWRIDNIRNPGWFGWSLRRILGG